MYEVIITGLNIVTQPKETRAGSVVIAYFDCTVGPFALSGCALVQTRRHGLSACPPRLVGPGSEFRSVRITCQELRRLMTEKARDAYRMMGGMQIGMVPNIDGSQAEASKAA